MFHLIIAINDTYFYCNKKVDPIKAVGSDRIKYTACPRVLQDHIAFCNSTKRG